LQRTHETEKLIKAELNHLWRSKSPMNSGHLPSKLQSRLVRRSHSKKRSYSAGQKRDRKYETIEFRARRE